MLKINCQRCRSEFYTASPATVKVCPYCGFTLDVTEPARREEERAEIDRDCVLLKGTLRLDARAVDISKKGLGVKLAGSVPFGINDTVHVIIKDFDIDANAKVVWIRKSRNTVSKAGFRLF